MKIKTESRAEYRAADKVDSNKTKDDAIIAQAPLPLVNYSLAAFFIAKILCFA